MLTKFFNTRRKLKLFTFLLALVASLAVMATEGALSGKFTINSNGDQIVFSQGNLQYVGTWQFAENQWNVIGNAQADNNRDLFGWGTGNAPNKVSTDNSDYATFTDWGVNPITNGGNEANAWRTLTRDEWKYLFYSRWNAATLFGLGSVNGVNGTILLPDNWVLPAGASFTASTTQGLTWQSGYYYNYNGNNFSHNTYTAAQWAVMEAAGAVFLPAAGYRRDTNVSNVGSVGRYWSATPIDDASSACNFIFSSESLDARYYNGQYNGQSVRLVQAAPAASLTSAPTAKSLTYNGSAQALVNAGTASGGTMNYSLDNSTWSTSIPTATNADDYTVYYKVVGDASHTDYTPSPNTVAVTINKAALSITADNKSVTYGDAAPTYTASYSGFVGSETASVLGGTLAFACEYAAGSNVGGYTITPSGVTASNYDITFNTGTLTVNKANPVVTAPTAKSLTYNGSAQALVDAGSTTGGELQYSLSSGTGYGDAISTQTNADTYTVYFKVNGNTNYNAVAEQSISVTINKAALSITAENKSLTYGDNPPTYTASYSGFVGSETASVLSGTLAFACEYAAGSNVGGYTITPSGVTASNYDITFNAGTLTVNKADAVITDTPASIEGLVYTGAAQTLISAGSATGGTLQYKLDDGAYGTSLPQATDADTYTIYYKVDGDGNHNDVAEASFSVTIGGPTDQVLTANQDPNRTSDYYSTFYHSAIQYSLPEGTQAYIATLDGDALNLTKIAEGGDVLPADNAVILKASGSSITLTPSDEAPVTFDVTNNLLGVDEATATPANCYVLSGEDGVVGFYQYSGTNLNAHKAYVVYSTSAGAPRRMPFVFDSATGVENVQGDKVQSTKVLRDGQLMIIRNGVEYNATGQMVK